MEEFSQRDSLPAGINVIMPFSNSLLSFKKKKEINKTENKPILKLPIPLTNEFKKFGINIDKSCKDICRLRGYSIDIDAYFNHNASVFKIKTEIYIHKWC